MMTAAKELLDAATPLPWHQGTDDIDDADDFPIVSTTWATAEDAALIVYAVNRLPDYEAAVEALERAMSRMLRAADRETRFWLANILEEEGVDPALARLREQVTA